MCISHTQLLWRLSTERILHRIHGFISKNEKKRNVARNIQKKKNENPKHLNYLSTLIERRFFEVTIYKSKLKCKVLLLSKWELIFAR